MKLKQATIAVCCAAFGLLSALAQAQPHAISVAPSGVNCNGGASLDVAWTGLGAVPHFELGDVTKPDGTDLGGFSDTSPRGPLDSYSGGYGISYTGVIPAGTLIGIYAEVGQRPPLASNTLQFFILTNCSTQQVLFSFVGNYGSCPKKAQDVQSQAVPTASRETMAALALLLAAAGAFLIRRRVRARR